MPKSIEIRLIEKAEGGIVTAERVLKSTADPTVKWATLLDAAFRVGQKTAVTLDTEDEEGQKC